jgi:hypothetical protein
MAFAVNRFPERLMNKRLKPTPQRCTIDVADANAVKYWSRALGINRAMLFAVVQKVGNSPSAVRKELKSVVGGKL